PPHSIPFPTRRSSDLASSFFSVTILGKATPCRIRHSRAISSTPSPPMRDTVPVKKRSTNGLPSPIHSKIWAPRYEASVEIPIFRSEEHTSELQSRENI